MAHTFLALDMNLIPQSTKDNVPTFWMGLFSNDQSRMLIDGYNEQGVLVHPQATLDAWLQWSDNPQEIQYNLLAEAIEYTSSEFTALKNDINSIWYFDAEVEL
jgi:uncharacterized protein YhdP